MLLQSPCGPPCPPRRRILIPVRRQLLPLFGHPFPLFVFSHRVKCFRGRSSSARFPLRGRRRPDFSSPANPQWQSRAAIFLPASLSELPHPLQSYFVEQSRGIAAHHAFPYWA